MQALQHPRGWLGMQYLAVRWLSLRLTMMRTNSVSLTYLALHKLQYDIVCWLSIHWRICPQPYIAIYWWSPPLSSSCNADGLFTSTSINLYFNHWLNCAMHRCVPFIPPNNDPPCIVTAFDPTAKPIRVSPRTRGKKCWNIFYDNRSFFNQSLIFNVILHNINGGCILCKYKHPAPSLRDINPLFYSPYAAAIHGAKLRRDLDLSHLDISLRNWVYHLIQKYWSVFNDKGQFVPI